MNCLSFIIFSPSPRAAEPFSTQSSASVGCIQTIKLSGKTWSRKIFPLSLRTRSPRSGRWKIRRKSQLVKKGKKKGKPVKKEQLQIPRYYWWEEILMLRWALSYEIREWSSRWKSGFAGTFAFSDFLDITSHVINASVLLVAWYVRESREILFQSGIFRPVWRLSKFPNTAMP